MENNFDVLAQAYEDAMNEGDYTTALAIQSGMNQAVVDTVAQHAYDSGVRAAQQQQTPQQTADDDEAASVAAYDVLFDSLDARKAEVQRVAGRKTAQKIIDTARDSYSWKVKNGEGL